MKGIGVLAGALLAAIAASACCILPLLLGAAAAGTVGVGAALAPYRPYLVGLTVLLLGLAFYLTYRPVKATSGAECCATPKALWMRRFSRAVLWIGTVFTLGAMAYPRIAARQAVVNAGSFPPTAAPATTKTAVFTIGNMICAECSQQIADALKKTPGVYEAKVDYGTKSAEVRYDPRKVSPEQLRAAIDRTGFPVMEVTARSR
jgi:mercuric ion transport protein